ncbi:hypothetical protein [Rhodococcoides kyotonense]|uniref:Asp23/Gls24 family envelope stress response protein n=1 Tax=Rhodococcoides kyotonense TaxID=398843 RepID=A0A177YAQ6_9NOCA|nr:hypothetical protein [Rhodococcus kyotonensis]OAK52450.1 hypothetical protein A3K89_06360 [Rhodococcus kyotonensis]
MSVLQEHELADAVAAAALSAAGVVALNGGEFGEIATYLPGRKVVGVRIHADGCDVHITAEYPSDVHAVARGVVGAVQPLITVPVSVTVEDVRFPGDKS